MKIWMLIIFLLAAHEAKALDVNLAEKSGRGCEGATFFYDLKTDPKMLWVTILWQNLHEQVNQSAEQAVCRMRFQVSRDRADGQLVWKKLSHDAYWRQRLAGGGAVLTTIVSDAQDTVLASDDFTIKPADGEIMGQRPLAIQPTLDPRRLSCGEDASFRLDIFLRTDAPAASREAKTNVLSLLQTQVAFSIEPCAAP